MSAPEIIFRGKLANAEAKERRREAGRAQMSQAHSILQRLLQRRHEAQLQQRSLTAREKIAQMQQTAAMERQAAADEAALKRQKQAQVAVIAKEAAQQAALGNIAAVKRGLMETKESPKDAWAKLVHKQRLAYMEHQDPNQVPKVFWPELKITDPNVAAKKATQAELFKERVAAMKHRIAIGNPHPMDYIRLRDLGEMPQPPKAEKPTPKPSPMDLLKLEQGRFDLAQKKLSAEEKVARTKGRIEFFTGKFDDATARRLLAKEWITPEEALQPLLGADNFETVFSKAPGSFISAATTIVSKAYEIGNDQVLKSLRASGLLGVAEDVLKIGLEKFKGQLSEEGKRAARELR